jgi:hypothetical protein
MLAHLLHRNLDHLQHDLDNEYVSVESAKRDYGAIVDQQTHKIDCDATDIKRKKLKTEWKRDEIFIDQKSKPFASRGFRIIKMEEIVN